MKLGIFISQSCSDGKERYKKVCCTCKVVVLLFETYCFFDVLVSVVGSQSRYFGAETRSVVTALQFFSQNVVVGETSHQILEIFHLAIGRGLSIR